MSTYFDITSNKNIKDLFPTNGKFGGTEYMREKLCNVIENNIKNFNNYSCILFPGAVPTNPFVLTNPHKQPIYWVHNLASQFDEIMRYQFFDDPRIYNNIKNVIVVSEYHKEIMIKETSIPEEKFVVIYNTIDNITNDMNRFKNVEKIKIIHTSESSRGMFVLLESLKYLDDDFELHIYNNFNPDHFENDIKIKQLTKDERITFHGQTPRKTLYKALSESHIFAYPSIFLETFCLAQAEAISAGCLTVYHEIGSLKEISSEHGISYTLDKEDNHAEIFANNLSKAIDIIRSGNFNPQNQINYVNEKFSLENFKNNWIDFSKTL